MPISAEPGRPGTRAAALDDTLAGLLADVPGLEAAAVVTPDGLPMAAALPAGMDEEKVAALSAALLALGERAASGLGRGGLAQVCIEGETGTVVLVGAGSEAVLVAVAGTTARTGLVLWEVRRAAAAVAAAFAVQHLPAAAPLLETPPVAPAAEPDGWAGTTHWTEPAGWEAAEPTPLAPALPLLPSPSPAAHDADPAETAVWTAYQEDWTTDWTAVPPAPDSTVLPGGLR